MLETLKERKEALEAQGKKGFTLMEMLIVIAIIAILIAIAIPLFTAQLEAARDSTSIANMRSAYAEAQATYIAASADTSASAATHDADTYKPKGIVIERDATSKKIKTITIANVKIESEQANDWSGQGYDLPWVKADATAVTPGDTGASGAGVKGMTFTYKDGQLDTDTAPTLVANPSLT